MSMSCYRHQQLGFGILLECLFPYWSTHSELGEPCPRSLVRNAGKATSRRRRSALTVGPANRPPITTQQGFRRCSALHHSPSSPSSEPLSKLCLAYYEEARRRAIDRTKTRSIATRDRIFHGLDSVCRSNWKPTRNRPGSNGNRWTTCLRAGALAKRYSVDRNFHSRCCGKRRHGTRGTTLLEIGSSAAKYPDPRYNRHLPSYPAVRKCCWILLETSSSKSCDQNRFLSVQASPGAAGWEPRFHEPRELPKI